MVDILEIKNLNVAVEGKQIIKNLNLTIKRGEIHALMGPNGSGKSTLAYAIMGHPKYEITSGQVLFNGQDVTEMKIYERAKLGLFTGLQYPIEIPGVTMMHFLRTAYEHAKFEDVDDAPDFDEFLEIVESKLEILNMNESFLERYVNAGFSGGEKKKAEILQLLLLEPKIAILDETDSGLDVDALRDISKAINKIFEETSPGILLITHYQRILNYIKPHHVHVMINGHVVLSGGPELAKEIEEKGYDWIKNNN